MKYSILTFALLSLTGCSITRQPQLSEVNTVSGIVRLTYQQAYLQSAHTDNAVAQGIANQACQRLGYADALPFGQPVATCDVFAGSLCLNTTFTLSYQCQGRLLSSPDATPAW